MPVDVERLLRSKIARIARRDPRAGWHSFVLWCSAWHSVPAGSVPNDADDLADLAQCSPETWAEIRSTVLRSTTNEDGTISGWILCSDNRWYHTFVVEMAMTAWKGTLSVHYDRECGRVRKDHFRRTGSNKGAVVPSFDAWLAQRHPMSAGRVHLDKPVCPPGQPPVQQDNATSPPGQPAMSSRTTPVVQVENALNRAEHNRAEQIIAPPVVQVDRSGTDQADAPDSFASFWSTYAPPRTARKAEALKAWKATEKTRPADPILFACVKLYIEDLERQSSDTFKRPKVGPANWLNEAMWEPYLADAKARAERDRQRERETAVMLKSWGDLAEPVIAAIGKDTFWAWFRSSFPKKNPTGGTIIVCARQIHADMINQRYAPILERILEPPVEVVFIPPSHLPNGPPPLKAPVIPIDDDDAEDADDVL